MFSASVWIIVRFRERASSSLKQRSVEANFIFPSSQPQILHFPPIISVSQKKTPSSPPAKTCYPTNHRPPPKLSPPKTKNQKSIPKSASHQYRFFAGAGSQILNLQQIRFSGTRYPISRSERALASMTRFNNPIKGVRLRVILRGKVLGGVRFCGCTPKKGWYASQNKGVPPPHFCYSYTPL